MIIHRTYSGDGTKMIHIPYVPCKGYHRMVWGGVRLYPNRLSVNDLMNLGIRMEVIPKEPNAHS